MEIAFIALNVLICGMAAFVVVRSRIDLTRAREDSLILSTKKIEDLENSERELRVATLKAIQSMASMLEQQRIALDAVMSDRKTKKVVPTTAGIPPVAEMHREQQTIPSMIPRMNGSRGH